MLLTSDDSKAVIYHWGRVTHICVGKLTIFDAVQATSHYLIQCWNIVNWTIINNLQWHSNRNSNIFIDENTFENFCEMLSFSSRPQCGIQSIIYFVPVNSHMIRLGLPYIMLFNVLTSIIDCRIETWLYTVLSSANSSSSAPGQNGRHFAGDIFTYF